ncbi:MAG: SPOR domain-containing protein [Pseudomonadota bacterium]
MAAVLMLAACQPGAGPFAKKAGSDTASPADAKPATSVRLVDRDVEAPEVFQVTDQALWDGRPSLGGVWVASPDAKDPERVIMRNPGNGKFVIGALFRRERDNPGPALQISSDAAAALGLLAGEPGRVSVTALRRDEAGEDVAPDATRPILDAAESVETTALADAGAKPAAARTAARSGAPVMGAAEIATAALDAVDSKPAAANARPTATPKAPLVTAPVAGPVAGPVAAPVAAKPAPAAAGGGLIQIGIFSVEANAKRAADTLTKAGIGADIRKETAQGKSFWSLTARGDAASLTKIKAAGFADAYPLKR